MSASQRNSWSKIVALWMLRLLWRLIKWSVLTAIYRTFPNWQRRQTDEEIIQDFYKSRAWWKLSQWARDKYGDQCMKCKKNPTAYPRLRIVTDHIKPIRFYWHLRLDRSNLQRLCDGCNKAKGSWDMTDYRNYRPGKMVPKPICVPVLAPPRGGDLVMQRDRVYRPRRERTDTYAIVNSVGHYLPEH